MKRYFLLCFSLLFLLPACRSELDRELAVLDSEIEKIPLYKEAFDRRCDSLRLCLASASSDSARFVYALALNDAYSPNNVDSTSRYAGLLEMYAGADKSNRAIAAACRSICHIKYGDLSAAAHSLEHISGEGLSRQAMVYYYRAKNWVYSLTKKGEPDRWDPVLEYWQKDSTSTQVYIFMGNYCTSHGDYDRAVQMYDRALAQAESYYFKATANMFKAAVYQKLGDVETRKHYLIQSALYDLKNCAKEYESLFILARVLNREKDYHHAIKFSQMTLEDAAAANYVSRLAASIQASKIYSETYNETQKQKHRILFAFIIVMSVLIVVLSILMIWLRSANRALYSSRQALRERTMIQNKFLGEYMELSSKYIDEVDRSRSNFRKILKEDGVQALSKLLRAPSYAEREIKRYYENFDTTFLAVFPDFKEKVAELLHIPAVLPASKHLSPPDVLSDSGQPSLSEVRPTSGKASPPKVVPNVNPAAPDTDSGEPAAPSRPSLMTVELRILALMRLGITDQKRICNVLHISHNTCYTYLYKMRKASGLSPREFVSKVQLLCRE